MTNLQKAFNWTKKRINNRRTFDTKSYILGCAIDKYQLIYSECFIEIDNLEKYRQLGYSLGDVERLIEMTNNYIEENNIEIK